MISISHKQRFILISRKFDMHCGSCYNIPFWRWLKGNHTFTISITCNDFDGEHLPNVQLNNVTDCFGEYLCTSFWKSYQLYCTCMKNIDPFFYKEKFEVTKEVIRSRRSKDKQRNDKRQNHKQQYTKYFTENLRSGNKNTTKNEDELRCSG